MSRMTNGSRILNRGSMLIMSRMPNLSGIIRMLFPMCHIRNCARHFQSKKTFQALKFLTFHCRLEQSKSLERFLQSRSFQFISLTIIGIWAISIGFTGKRTSVGSLWIFLEKSDPHYWQGECNKFSEMNSHRPTTTAKLAFLQHFLQHSPSKFHINLGKLRHDGDLGIFRRFVVCSRLYASPNIGWFFERIKINFHASECSKVNRICTIDASPAIFGLVLLPKVSR